MLAIQIKDVKNFMKLLLISDTFDEFEMVHATISTSNIFDIDGKVDKTFFGEEYEVSDYYEHEYTPWKLIKEMCFGIIKGKHTPLAFKFILHAGREVTSSILAEIPETVASNIKSLILTIRYDEHGLMLTSGTASASFIADKSVDEAWDKWVAVFTQDMQ